MPQSNHQAHAYVQAELLLVEITRLPHVHSLPYLVKIIKLACYNII